MVNIKLIKLVNLTTCRIYKSYKTILYTNSQMKVKVDYDELIKYLEEFNIIDKDHFPNEGFEDWFEVRPISEFPRYLLAVTCYGEGQIIDF